jgi:hypothetical protein
MTVLASMQLVHGGEVGHGVELDSEGVHLQHELVRRLYQLCVRLLAERVRANLRTMARSVSERSVSSTHVALGSEPSATAAAIWACLTFRLTTG